MRYDRRNLGSTLKAAQRAASKHNRTYYVFATALGMTIDTSAPPFGQQHYIVNAQGFEYVDVA